MGNDNESGSKDEKRAVSSDSERKEFQVIPDSEKLWGWNTEYWDLPENLSADLGLDKPSTFGLAREWGWSGW